MVIADLPEPGWLQAAGQAAAVVLVIELLLLVLIVAALVLGLAFGLLYVHNKVVPILTRFAPAIEQRLQTADRGTSKLAERVIDFHARTEAVKEGLRTLIRPERHRELPPGQNGARALPEGYRNDGPRRLPGGRDDS